MLDKLSPAARKQIEKYYDPVALGIGLVLVAGPSVNEELRLQKALRQPRVVMPQEAEHPTNGNVPTGPVDPAASPLIGVRILG